MARISERNPRYRNKAEICKDISIILQINDLSYAAKFAVVAEAIWVWSEFYGKYKGCLYWSEAALSAEQVPNTLVHEHAIPRKILTGLLMEMKKPSKESVMRLLSKFCIGVVVTKSEDKALNAAGLRSKMPEMWDFDNEWARYEAVGIVPVKVIES